MPNTVEKLTALVGSIYEDTTGSSTPLAGYGKGTRWQLVGVGCDGVFVGQSGGSRVRLLGEQRYKLVKKGKGDSVKGWWQFHQGNLVTPFTCKHGEAVSMGVEKPQCVDCQTYLKIAKEREAAYKNKARTLWKTAY